MAVAALTPQAVIKVESVIAVAVDEVETKRY
jgi:hypothetical protein